MKNHYSGFTLVEVMIAVVILAVGLLGLASLMVRSQQSNESAYARSQASLMAYDIIDRMRANKVAYSSTELRKVSYATQNNAYALDELPTPCGTPASGNQAAGSAQATQDIRQWCNGLTASLPGLVPGGTSIVRSGNRYTVRIQWQEPSSDGLGTQLINVEAEL
ncbi:type IV pilus modification protein PilV [Pseudomonas sp. PDM15]|jgi:type IV pilus assembly protein PilV|uniref:type IV pilus modification protein PilV n=1 Tax=Pseudomonas sp. PDM15 TaxID=2769303 RepID=UPI0017837B8C|nr:type IV pilus modification protein PilV [Pseudomonas sp. PDM15]MBD9426803.1 type IV pilus modification protein PilV [Pseudomonas sp. PDM15]